MRRQGLTTIEILMVVTLGLSVLGFVVSATRTFTLRTARSTDEAQRQSELARFLTRIRRVLRFGAIQVEAFEGGFRVVHLERDPGTGGLRPGVVEFRIDEGSPGRIRVGIPGGAWTEYQLGGSRVALKARGVGGAVEVDLESEDLVTRATTLPLIRSLSVQRGEALAAVRADLSPEVIADLPRVGWGAWEEEPKTLPWHGNEEASSGREPVTALGREPKSSARVETSRNRDPGSGDPVTANVDPGNGAARSSLDTEVDVVGAEIGPLGDWMLSPGPRRTPPATGIARLETRLTSQGVPEETAGVIAAVLDRWERARAVGARRTAASAVADLVRVARADGLDPSGLARLVRSTSRVAASAWDGRYGRGQPPPATPAWIVPALSTGLVPDPGPSPVPWPSAGDETVASGAGVEPPAPDFGNTGYVPEDYEPGLFDPMSGSPPRPRPTSFPTGTTDPGPDPTDSDPPTDPTQDPTPVSTTDPTPDPTDPVDPTPDPTPPSTKLPRTLEPKLGEESGEPIRSEPLSAPVEPIRSLGANE